MTSRWSVMCIHVTGAHYIVLRIYREDVLVQNKCVLQKISLIVGHDVLISEAGCRLRPVSYTHLTLPTICSV